MNAVPAARKVVDAQPEDDGNETVAQYAMVILMVISVL